MYFFHRIDSISRTGLFFLITLLVLTLMIFLPACSRDSADNLVGPVSSDSYDPSDRPDALGGSLVDERQKDIDRLNELQRQLIMLQQKVLQDNPDMQDQQQALQQAVESRLEETLAARNVDVARIQELQARLQTVDLSEEEKGELLGEFQVQAQQYNQARIEAMNDAQVQEKYVQYVTNMQALMEKEDPIAPELTREFEEIQARLQARQ